MGREVETVGEEGGGEVKGEEKSLNAGVTKFETLGGLDSPILYPLFLHFTRRLPYSTYLHYF